MQENETEGSRPSRISAARNSGPRKEVTHGQEKASLSVVMIGQASET